MGAAAVVVVVIRIFGVRRFRLAELYAVLPTSGYQNPLSQPQKKNPKFPQKRKTLKVKDEIKIPMNTMQFFFFFLEVDCNLLMI
ncbi:hypothetical protein GE061_010613 [Apolygus lucorum]|uniref:Uncharacterized protein n=1 Tax=Apolygus lucorum TaxID=248454 RepID=A0A6A4IMP2_APOLU|nr:hypothetical protein GE061_010613 [Apolygus lucorum]